METRDSNTIWRFAHCELHEGSHDLYVSGRLTALERKSFEALTYLLRRAGAVVSRDELVANVWAGRVVTDSVITRTVMKLRKALDDVDQQIIATVHGYGYRLSVPVEALPPGEKGERPAADTGVARLAAAPRKRSILALAATALASLIMVLAWNRLGTADPPHLALLPVAVTDAPTADWAELGLMAYLTTALGREFDVLPAGKALDAVGHDRNGAIERLRAAHGPLDVLETSLAVAGSGVQLRYTLHRVGQATLSGSLNADSPLAAADRLLERLNAALDGDWSTPSGSPLARELYARGRAAMLGGDARGARDYLQAALRENPDMPWARYEMALAWRQLGELDKARTALQELAAEAGVEPRITASAHQALAILHWRRGDLDRAGTAYGRALAIAKSHEMADVMPALLLNLGILQSSRGDYDRARDLYLRALQQSRERGYRDTQARVHNSLGVLAWRRGDVDASYREHARALEIRRGLDQPRDMAASLNNLATVALVRGQWQETESLLRQAVTLREELGDGAGLATTKRNLAKLAMLQGHLERAESLALESLQLAGEHGYASREADAFLLAGRIALLAGETTTARERFQAAVEAYRAIDHFKQSLGARLAVAGLPGADAGAARRLAERVLGDPALPHHLHAKALMLRADLRVTREPDEAAQDWQQALSIADELGHIELGIQVALDYAAMLIDAGRAAEAEPLMARLGEWPDYGLALQVRARYWEALGNGERARQLLARAE